MAKKTSTLDGLRAERLRADGNTVRVELGFGLGIGEIVAVTIGKGRKGEERAKAIADGWNAMAALRKRVKELEEELDRCRKS